MNNKSTKIIKKLIIILSLLIILILLILMSMHNVDSIGQNEVKTEEVYTDESEMQIKYETKKLTNQTEFFTVEQCINTYLDAINNDHISDTYQLLSDNYKSNNNITRELIGATETLKSKGNITALEMYILDGERIQKFSVKCIDKENNILYFIVNLDILNNTFSIEPVISNSIESITLENNLNEIENYTINEFEYIRLNNEDMANKYLDYYIQLLLKDSNTAFKMLDEEYKNARFNNNIDEFNNYINLNKENFELAILEKYSFEIKENYQEYVLQTTNDLYLTIKEDSIMNFKITLDPYTILSDEYKEEYNKLTDSKKISSNIQLIMLMLNNKDYKKIYSKLNDQFKKNNFATEEEFSNFLQTNFFNYNVFVPINTKQEGDIHIVTGTIKSGNTLSASEKEITIIMQLKDETDFVMSFSFE